MGLKITTDIPTSQGNSSEVYVMISEVYIPKTLKCDLGIYTYKSKPTRDLDVNDTCQTFVVAASYGYQLETIDVTITDLYNLVKATLISEGLTVVDEN